MVSYCNCRMIWVWRDLKGHPVSTLYHGQGHLPLEQTQSLTEPGLPHYLGWASSSSRQPVPVCHQLPSKGFLSKIESKSTLFQFKGMTSLWCSSGQLIIKNEKGTGPPSCCGKGNANMVSLYTVQAWASHPVCRLPQPFTCPRAENQPLLSLEKQISIWAQT